MRIDSDIGIFGFNNELASRNIRIVFHADIKKIFVHIRLNPIIRINESDIIPCAGIESRISRRRESAVFFMYNFYAAVLLRPFVAHGGTIIGRAIVNEDYLEILICLFNNAFNALVEILLDFINRDNDADKLRLIHIIRFPSFSTPRRILLHTASDSRK